MESRQSMRSIIINLIYVFILSLHNSRTLPTPLNPHSYQSPNFSCPTWTPLLGILRSFHAFAPQNLCILQLLPKINIFKLPSGFIFFIDFSSSSGPLAPTWPAVCCLTASSATRNQLELGPEALAFPALVWWWREARLATVAWPQASEAHWASRRMA